MDSLKPAVLSENQQTDEVSPNRKRKLVEHRLSEEDTTDDIKRQKQDIDFDSDYGQNIFTAPLQWTADPKTDANAVLVTEDSCITGTQDGRLLVFDLDGTFRRQWKFSQQVGSIFQDGDHLYAWVHPKYAIDRWKGSLYEIFEDEVRLMFDLVDFGDAVHHATMSGGCLALVDNHGSIIVLSVTGEFLWQRECNEGHRQLFHAIDGALYVAFKKRICKFAIDSGTILWEHCLEEGRASVIQRGVLNGQHIYAEVAGKIRQFDIETGDSVREFVPNRQKASGIAVGGGILLTGTCPTIVFNVEDGSEIAKMNFSGRLDNAASVISVNNRHLFTFWDMLYCVDLSEFSIKRAIAGRSRGHKEVKISEECTRVENTEPKKCSLLPGSLLVECIEIDGEIVGRTIMEEFDGSRNVALPFAWKSLGSTFIVDALEDCHLADCYRVSGRTRLLMDDVGVSSPKLETGRSRTTPGSKVEDKKRRRSSNYVTAISMQLQPISHQ